jgi:hypothetical protein
MEDSLRQELYRTKNVTHQRPSTAPSFCHSTNEKHEKLRNRVESQLRARINEGKRRVTSRDSHPASLSLKPSEHEVSVNSGPSLRQTRLREMLDAYSFSSNNQRSRSESNRASPPVLRRRLERPGRPFIDPQIQRKEDPESSESPVNFRRIHRRLMPPRPSSVSMIQRQQDTSSLNSTFNIKSQTLRSRLADLSQTMRIVEDKSSSVSPPPVSRRRKPVDTMRLIEDIRRRVQEISRGSSMFVDESSMPSMVIPQESPETPVQHSRDTFLPLNHMSRSIRDLHPSSPRAVSPANCWIRDNHSSLLLSSPSPSVSSLGIPEEESTALARRKQQARADLEQKQRELADSLRHSDNAVISLESLNVVGSSVRCLSDLIRAKELEIEAKKSEYLSRKTQQQLEYLKHLEQEAERIDRETLSMATSVIEEVSVPPLPPSLPIRSSPSPNLSSGKRTPEIFSISSPVRHAQDLSPVSPEITVPDEVYAKLGIDEMVLESTPEHDEVMVELMMSPLDKSSTPITPELEDISDNAKEVSLMEPEVVDQPSTHAEPVFTLSPEEDRCDKMEDVSVAEVTTTASGTSETDELVDLVVTSLIESIISDHFIELDRTSHHTNRSVIPRINTRIDSFDLVDSSGVLDKQPEYIDANLVAKTVIEAVCMKIWVSVDEELSDAHLDHMKRMIDYEEILLPLIPCSSVAACIADAFRVLIDSLPPAIAAEREWQIKFPGAHSPMAGYLPQRHSLTSLTKSLIELVNSYNRSISNSDQDIAQVEAFLCHEYLKKSKCDEILFQCNDSDMWTRFDSNTCSRAEAEIFEDVSLFVFEAIISSIAADFQT